jgi:hypothetical protein
LRLAADLFPPYIPLHRYTDYFYKLAAAGSPPSMFGIVRDMLSSGVSPGTANSFAYLMLVIVGVFLVASAAIAYIYIRKSRRENPAPAASPA